MIAEKANYLTAKGWLTTKERQLLKDLAEDVSANGHILNVGIEYGASVVCLRAGTDATITAIDLVGDEKLQTPVDNVTWIKGDSGSFARLYNGDGIDLAFIDGDHSYRGVLRDIEFCRHIPIDGIVAFHDCYSWEAPKTPHKICPEVNQAVQDWHNGNSHKWRELEPVDSIRIFERVA